MSQLGYAALDADHLNRDLLALPAVCAEIQSRFPDEEGLLDADGALRKDVLRARIVRDPVAREALEAFLHPLIATELMSRYQTFVRAAPGGAWLFYEASLLFEAKREADFDAVVVVDAPLEVRLKRLRGPRALPDGVARALLEAQMEQAEKLRRATVVASNASDSAADLQEEVLRVLAALRTHFAGEGTSSPPLTLGRE